MLLIGVLSHTLFYLIIVKMKYSWLVKGILTLVEGEGSVCNKPNTLSWRIMATRIIGYY
jgi:hypothetical protein